MQPASDASRRDFVTRSAVAGAALAGGLSVARSAYAAGSETLRAVLIGCGGRGTGAADNLLGSVDGVKLVAVADAFEDRARGALKRLGEKHAAKMDIPADRVFVGLDAFQKAIDCGVDLVLLATPPGFRPMQYAAAIKAGKNVFMEKPCCTDAPGYRSLIETNKLADAKNLKVVVGLQRHHQSGYIKGVQEIHDGKLGDIRFLRVYWNGSGGGARDLGPRPQNDPKEMEFQIRNWGCFVWLYGDNIVEQHVHNLDIANWVMAKNGDFTNAHPVEAEGMGGRINKGNYGDIFDYHFVEFTYANGTKMFSQCRHVPGTWGAVSEYAHGTEGNRGVSVGNGPKLEDGNPYNQEHIDLVKAIRGDTRLNEGWFGANSSMTAVLGRMATWSGQIVKWDDAVAKGPSEFPERLAWDAAPRHLPNDKGFYPEAIPGVYKAY